MKYSSTFLSVVIIGSCSAIAIAFYHTKTENIELPEVVRIQAEQYNYRPAGEFRIGTRVVDAPMEKRTTQNDFEIMKYHVSEAEYNACVADYGCYGSLSKGATDFPQVNVSYIDATAYARWFSKKTQQRWRLPTDEEWVRAAGDRFSETILGPLSNDPDPSKLWLKKYRYEAKKRGESDPELRIIGSFGENNLGLADINGNIWEWTDSCFQNGKVSDDGRTLISSSNYCGVRAVQGKHRAFIIDFVRDAKGGGCAAGAPPDNLGFRLVRDS